MGPSDLCNQWLHSLIVPINNIKFKHIEDIAPGKATDSGKLRPHTYSASFNPRANKHTPTILSRLCCHRSRNFSVRELVSITTTRANHTRWVREMKIPM